MKIAVWDTYVPRKMTAGEATPTVMHFDILVPDGTSFETVQRFGRIFLGEKGEDGQPLTTAECKFCHIEEANASVIADVQRTGFSIIEMQGCEARPQSYTPIDCGFYDLLEAVAVKKTVNEITLSADGSTTRIVKAAVRDLFSRDGVEYAILAGADDSTETIRLDEIVSVNGFERPA